MGALPALPERLPEGDEAEAEPAADDEEDDGMVTEAAPAGVAGRPRGDSASRLLPKKLD